MSRKNASKLGKVEEQLTALHAEIGALSKRKPDDAVNKFKLKFINEVLSEANSILDADHKPFKDFTSFDEDELPTNSDVVLILSQYRRCVRQQRLNNPV
jgi:hypothetical protein